MVVLSLGLTTVSADPITKQMIATDIATGVPGLTTTGEVGSRRQTASASVLLGVTPIPDDKPEIKSKNVITDPVEITDVNTLGTDDIKEGHDLPESGTLDDSTVIQAPDINQGP